MDDNLVLSILDREITRAGGNDYADGRELIAVRAAVAELIRKARCWDSLTAARETPHTDADNEWKKTARGGDVIAAIKACRALHGFSLREAKDVVEGYLSGGRA